jgi:(p)ppGpp synthase/HD superfamily hydrolase
MIFRAIEFAARAHSGQYRKGTGVPYLVHPLNVAQLLIRAGASEPVSAAGVLHDVVEDTAATLNEIAAHFGTRVAQLVEGASEPDKTDTWENRKGHTIRFLKSTPDPDLLCLSLADKLDNIRSLREDLQINGEAAWARFNRGRDQQRWYYTSLASVYSARVSSPCGIVLLKPFLVEVELVFPNGRAVSAT